jgi:chromosome segregation ATPase
MFENLRDAFREAIENFKEELNKEDPPRTAYGTVDRLLHGMRNEVAQARSTLRGLNEQIEQTREQILHESTEETTCRRREEMAQRVGDEETARIAREYAARHSRRREVLGRKVAALEEEHAMRAAEVAEMLNHVRETEEKRDTLAAARKSGEPGTARAADELIADLDRMASAIDDTDPAPRSRTIDEIEREYADLQVDPWAPVERPNVDFDERLAELKRRMGRE